MLLERAPFPAAESYLGRLPTELTVVRDLGANDIYGWAMARLGGGASGREPEADKEEGPDGCRAEDLKVNLIYPCTEAHVKKYRRQGVRSVSETADIYRRLVRPYMEKKREGGGIQWVVNIIEGKTEAEDVIYRTRLGEAGDEGFLLLPDLNWDRRTLEALHLLAIVERRDIWSLRDLKKKDISWLRQMRSKLLLATTAAYPSIEPDQLKLYVHYQPTYYHFHIHIVHVALEPGATQATGKAIGLESIIETLALMEGGEEAGMDRLCLHYTVGEASALWSEIFAPLKRSERAPR